MLNWGKNPHTSENKFKTSHLEINKGIITEQSNTFVFAFKISMMAIPLSILKIFLKFRQKYIKPIRENPHSTLGVQSQYHITYSANTVKRKLISFLFAEIRLKLSKPCIQPCWAAATLSEYALQFELILNYKFVIERSGSEFGHWIGRENGEWRTSSHGRMFF